MHGTNVLQDCRVTVLMSYKTVVSDFFAFVRIFFFGTVPMPSRTDLSETKKYLGDLVLSFTRINTVTHQKKKLPEKKVPGSFGTVMYQNFDLQSGRDGTERGAEREGTERGVERGGDEREEKRGQRKLERR